MRNGHVYNCFYLVFFCYDNLHSTSSIVLQFPICCSKLYRDISKHNRIYGKKIIPCQRYNPCSRNQSIPIVFIQDLSGAGIDLDPAAGIHGKIIIYIAGVFGPDNVCSADPGSSHS